ncbi:MAG: LamG-like jellyroll fold domain-containing protein [Planctomycetota bacterium]|jgi:hypothetical protein
MSQPDRRFNEVARLASALCDEEITPQEVARLEQLASRSASCRRFLIEYVQLHGELLWDSAVSARCRVPPECEEPKRGDGEPAQPHGQPPPSPRRPARFWWGTGIAVAASLFIASWLSLRWLDDEDEIPDSPGQPAAVAQLTRTFQAEWPDGLGIEDKTFLLAGQELDLRNGLAEVLMNDGAHVILEGPALFRAVSANETYLTRGRLTAQVPDEARGFAVQTADSVFVDLGTEFAVAVERDGTAEVCVFTGAVEVWPAENQGPAGPLGTVGPGQTFRVTTSAGTSRLEEVAIPSSRAFVRNFPLQCSVAAFSEAVAGHPSLIHHYTFEGATPQEQRLDKKGDLDLIEAMMVDGSPGGQVDYSVTIDGKAKAIRPYRSLTDGNRSGAGLQSRRVFSPSPNCTVELLLCFGGFPDGQESQIAAAVATRASQQDCGLLIVAADHGNLVHLMTGDASWVESDVFFVPDFFVPDDWYYVASTFRVDSSQTIINTYVANLSEGETTLKQVVADHPARGTPAAGRLGIGKGFIQSTTNGYPWSGLLDEVAIYDAVLTQEELQEHLSVLTSQK